MFKEEKEKEDEDEEDEDEEEEEEVVEELSDLEYLSSDCREESKVKKVTKKVRTKTGKVRRCVAYSC